VGGVSGMQVSVVGNDERDSAVATLVAAFVDDPVERWLYPELDAYRAHFPDFVAAFGAGAFEERTVWKLGDLSAVALWLGPGIAPDGDAIVGVLAETVSPDKHDDSFRFSARWIEPTRRFHTGTSRGSAFVQSSREAGLAAGCWSTAFGLWTRVAFPPTPRLPIHARFRSMSALDSRRCLSRSLERAHRSRPC
jgi:hypothetical protein